MAAPPPTPFDAQDLERLRRLAGLLDSRWRVPLLGWRFGLDSVVGLVPGIGDTAMDAVGAYIVWRAWRMGAPGPLVARMALNVGLDWAVGSVPVLGDLFDVAFKSNRRNMDLLERHFADAAAGGPPPGRPATPGGPLRR